MRFLWLDTETTGLEPSDSSIIQIAFILVEKGKAICERCFYLNPLSETIKYHESVLEVHGITEAEIRKFPPEEQQVKRIAEFLTDAREMFKKDGSNSKKLIASGYNVGFDMKHLDALLTRNGYDIKDYFSGMVADVYEQVKKAGMQKALPYLENRKLRTVAKYLGVNLENAHSALDDIKATRQVAAKLHAMGVSLL